MLSLGEDHAVDERFAVGVTNDVQYRVACSANIVLSD